MPIEVILMIILGFISGSIMFSYLLPKYLKGIDIINASEDNNPGAANSFKLCGPLIGILSVALDFFKGFIPVYISIKLLKVTDAFLIPIAIAPVLGHAFSPFLKFKGGKAIASFFGVLCALIPLSNIVIAFAVITIFLKVIISINPNSTMMLVAIAIFDIYILLSNEYYTIKIIALLLSLIVAYKHMINRDKRKLSIKIFNKYPCWSSHYQR